MRAAAKKETDISNNKIRKASSSYKAYMAGPMKVKYKTSGAGEVQQEIAAMRQDEAARDMVQQAEVQKIQETQQRQATMESVQEKQLKEQIKDLESKAPSQKSLSLLYGLAWLMDIAEIPLALLGGIGGIAVDFVFLPVAYLMLGPDFFMKAFWKTKVKVFGKNWPIISSIPLLLVGFIPFLDFTFNNKQAIEAIKNAAGDTHKALDAAKKQLKMLKEGGGGGGPAKKGFAGYPGRFWAIFLTILLSCTLILFSIFGMGAFIAAALFLVAFFLWIAWKSESGKPIIKTVGILVVILLIIGSIVVFAVGPFIAGFGGPAGEMGARMVSAPARVGDFLVRYNPITAIQNYYKKQVYIATGDYYTGKVDENAQAKLGVFLEDLKQADPVFYIDRPVTMYATLKVHTLDESINVSLYCNSTGLKDDAPSPKLFPQSQFLVDLYEERDIDCLFDANSMNPTIGAKFTLGASFNFKTMSYVKSYFMDHERLRSLRREEIDPLEQYGITDKYPTATYTNGPVGVGMGVGKPPVGIEAGQEQTTTTLGITIDNKWDGIVTEIKRVAIILPMGFELIEIGVPFEKVLCSDLPAEEQDLCSDNFNNVYIVKDNPPKLYKGNFKSYRGYLRINKADYGNVLGLNPIATHYFKTTVEYTYSLEKMKRIDIRSRQTTSLIAGSGDVDISPPDIENTQENLNIEAGTATITWKTTEESNDLFKWWDTKTAYRELTTPNEAGFTKEHSRTITELTVGTEYGYEIKTSDQAGNQASISRRFKFTS